MTKIRTLLTFFAFVLMYTGFTLLCALATLEALHASSRIKDVVSVEGVRDNQLVGYGLVVGLNGTGDGLKGAPFTTESLVAMLERMGVNIRDQIKTLGTKNVAAVMVTSTLPPFARQGSTVDVQVSALGDAKNLLGGTLLVTPLNGADGEVYAVAQGPISTGGFTASGNSGTSVTKGVPTSGRIANGAIVEREIGFELNQMQTLKLALKNPDFTTSKRIAQAINAATQSQSAIAKDPTTVEITPPSRYGQDIVAFMTDIEQLQIQPDQIARVIIDEQNGVIVMGDNVRISKVAVSHGNLTIKISETPQVSQPGPFANVGETVVVPRTKIDVNEQDDRKMVVLPEAITLDTLVSGLNALGVSPRDMITILQTIKSAGALQADIEVI